jgi:hypothetical protein
MAFKLGFNERNAEPYTGLVDEDDVYEAIIEETRKAIAGMGSDGYDLVWPADLIKRAGGEDKISDYLDGMPGDETSRLTLEAHDRGVEQATRLAAPSIHKELWIRYRQTSSGEVDTAVKNRTTSKLPDGTTIWLEEED